MRTPAAWIALAATLLLAAPDGSARADGPPTAVRAADPFGLVLLSAPDRRAVAVGEPLTLTVEGTAAPASAEADAALEAAFEALTWGSGPGDDFRLVRADPPTARRAKGGAGVEWTRRFVLRALRPGALALPPLVLRAEWRGATRSWPTAAHVVHAYAPDPALHVAALAVLPLVVEGESEGRPFRRIGSGFLVADDALVTAFHVVVDGARVRATLPDGRRLTLRRAWALDPARDVAVMAVDARAVRRAGLAPLAFPLDGAADTPVVDAPEGAVAFPSGNAVAFTAGWPGGVQRTTAGARFADLAAGPDALVRVTANRPRPGDSGGPLLDAAGRVLGVVVSGRSASDDPDLLREDLCLATDPRPALAARAERPVRLRRALAAAAAATPQARALRAAAVLLRPDIPPAASERHLAHLLDAIRTAPHDPALQFLAGSVLQALGDEERAAAAYESARTAPADYFPATYALAYHHYQRGEWARAESLFVATRAAEPYARLGALGLAQVGTHRLDYAGVERALGEVLAREPAFGPALFMLGWAHLAAGRRAEAEALAFRLGRLDAGWAARLRLALERPLLGPSALAPLPRATLDGGRADGAVTVVF